MTNNIPEAKIVTEAIEVVENNTPEQQNIEKTTIKNIQKKEDKLKNCIIILKNALNLSIIIIVLYVVLL